MFHTVGYCEIKLLNLPWNQFYTKFCKWLSQKRSNNIFLRYVIVVKQTSGPRLELSDRPEIRQPLRQQCCRCACQISKRYDNFKYQSRGFETLRDLTKRRLSGYWDGALNSSETHSNNIPIYLCYRKVSNIRRTKSQDLNDSHFILKSSLANPLKPGDKSRMEMYIGVIDNFIAY